MSLFRHPASLVFAAALLAPGCTQILGLGAEFHAAGAGGSGAASGGGGPHGGTGGTTSSSSNSSSTTSSTSSSSSSASSSSGAPTCTLAKQDCPGGQKCTVVDPQMGNTGCVAVSVPVAANYAPCTADADCGAFSWCEARTKVCKPLCSQASECFGKCVHAISAQGYAIPGLDVCVMDCDPRNTSACGTGATCIWDATTPIQSFDCFTSGGAAKGAQCLAQADCAPTLTCAGGTCSEWCHVGEGLAECASFVCQKFDTTQPKHDSSEFGYCW